MTSRLRSGCSVSTSAAGIVLIVEYEAIVLGACVVRVGLSRSAVWQASKKRGELQVTP